MNKTSIHQAVCLGIACLVAFFASMGQAQASVIVVGEVGDTIGSATNVDGNFDLSFDADIYNSTTIGHVSIQSENNSFNDVDWYSFTGMAGNTVDLDIDYGWNDNTFTVDTTLHLFDSTGTVLAFSDDSSLDPGSISGLDSFIGTYTLLSTGTYYAAVSNFSNFANGIIGFGNPLFTPGGDVGGNQVKGATGDSSFTNSGAYDSGTYTLHISTGSGDVGGEIPEPTTIVIWGCGLFGVTLLRRRKRS